MFDEFQVIVMIREELWIDSALDLFNICHYI
jgi:hypothetical protein